MKKLLAVVVCLLLVAGAALALTACPAEESGETSIKNLTYNGETITWSSVKNAKNYKIRIDNGTEAVVSQAEGTVSYRYDAAGKDFDFSVEAVIKEDSDKNPTYTIRFQNIGQVTGLAIADGNVTWDALDGAEKYEIMYNGDILPDAVGATSCAAKAGEFTYRVRALRGYAESTDGNIPYYSVWSDAITGTVLAAPGDLTYDSEVFTWEKVNGATSYIIKIGNEEFTATENRYAYAAGQEDFAVSVRAVGNAAGKIYDSAYGEQKSYTYIAPVAGLNVVDGVLRWTASENAVRYKIKVNGIVNNEELTVNEYAALASGTSYRIQLLPIGKSDFFFSRWSEEITVNILRSPVVSYGDGVIRWNQVTGCAGYELKIVKDGEVVHTTAVGGETFVYDYAFADAGDYLVYVKATSLGVGGVYESKYSTAYPVKRLATPTNRQIINRPLEKDQLSVTFSPSVGASGYILLADGVEIASITEGSSFSVDLSKLTARTAESVVNFRIIARGAVTTQGAVLDCTVPLEFNVTKLATPANLTINGNQISWDSVNNTSKYVLTIDGKRTEVTTTSFTLTDLSAGPHTVYVQAMGNGEAVITGGFSNALNLKKLATPANLTITNGLLTWGTVDGATAYRVVLGTETYNPGGTSFDLLGYASSIAEGLGTQISVYAVGNGSDIIDSDVSATRTVSKYTRPDNVKVSGDVLVWNPSSVNSINCNDYQLIITKDGGTPITVAVSGTSYAMSHFGAGNYTVKVVARGDNVQTVDSPASNEFSFTKLAAVTGVTYVDGTYTWSPVAGVSGYEIKLSKDATWITVDAASYTPVFTTEGEFEVSIRAVGNGRDIIDSDVYSFTQRVSRLTQPVEQEAMTNANAYRVEVSGNIVTVTVKKQAGATGYKLFVDGIDRSSTMAEDGAGNVVFTYTMTTVGATHRVQVQVLGGCFAENGTYMMDSNKSTETKVVYEG